MGGMDQQAFVTLLTTLQTEIGYQGPVYICRDHGGPWQRNIELDEAYPVEQAMDVAKQSFRADIEAGFNYLHIDPTKCPFPYAQEDLCNRTVELIAFCEDVRNELHKAPLDYEVGTEDIQGGLTASDTFESFLRLLNQRLDEKNLPSPTCIVGQTGTLVRIDRNVGHFDREKSRELVGIAVKNGIGFKEHNGDYLSAATCRIHPDLGITGMNVAPEFGLVETDACLALADDEAKLVREGWLEEADSSHFRELLLEITFTQTPWKKWMLDEVKQMDRQAVAADVALRVLIARVCGHYTYDLPEIHQARQNLYRNIERFGLLDDAQGFVLERVQRQIEFYLHHFRLDGINTLVDVSM